MGARVICPFYTFGGPHVPAPPDHWTPSAVGECVAWASVRECHQKRQAILTAPVKIP